MFLHMQSEPILRLASFCVQKDLGIPTSNPDCLDPPQSWDVVNCLWLRELASVAVPTSARAVLEPHRS